MKGSDRRGRKFPAEILTDAEVQALLAGCSRKAPTGIRNRALLALLYRGGLRISEALALKPKDLDAETGTLRILSGKGNKARTVGLDAGAFAVIELWLAARRKKRVGHQAPLFCTLAGKAIKAPYIRALLPRLARKAGIEKRVHAHGLRHTHAAQLAAEGIPLNVIQAQLGHSNAATTSRYLQHIAPQELVQAMRKREWSTKE